MFMFSKKVSNCGREERLQKTIGTLYLLIYYYSCNGIATQNYYLWQLPKNDSNCEHLMGKAGTVGVTAETVYSSKDLPIVSLHRKLSNVPLGWHRWISGIMSTLKSPLHIHEANRIKMFQSNGHICDSEYVYLYT